MTKQTNKEWLEQEFKKIDIEVTPKHYGFTFYRKFHINDILADYSWNGDDICFYHGHRNIKVSTLKRILKIAEEYKKRIEEEDE